MRVILTPYDDVSNSIVVLVLLRVPWFEFRLVSYSAVSDGNGDGLGQTISHVCDYT